MTYKQGLELARQHGLETEFNWEIEYSRNKDVDEILNELEIPSK